LPASDVGSQGLEGKVKLAQITKVPSVVAALEPDSPELLSMFSKAVEKITGEPAPKL
jgi:hypothetical protein